MSSILLPITPEMNQSFTCTLPVDDKNISLEFSLTYNSPGGYWFMSIADHDTGTLLIDALPLLSGEYPSANLLGQYSYLGIGSAVLISKSGDNSMPTFESLGREHLIAWGDNL
ncbi:phage baseplate plug family protein [Brevibacillus ginsengisoli]|uniref:phage baseplate plug family protein n=1 Tax=Brevibacillus ginsengisoli TaxID=363854 RepID=UPI003CEF25DD